MFTILKKNKQLLILLTILSYRHNILYVNIIFSLLQLRPYYKNKIMIYNVYLPQKKKGCHNYIKLNLDRKEKKYEK